MKRVSALLSAAAVVTMTVGVLAQAKPNFAGKWTMDAPAAAPGGGAPGGGAPGGGGRGGRGGGGWGMEPTITQDATTLTVEYMGGGQAPAPVKLTYKLDGTESKNTVAGRGGQQEQVSKATWDGTSLKIVTTTGFGEQTRTLSMDGAKLKIVTSQNGPDGTPITTTTTYSKAP
jgi:hypothetical protein